MIVLIEYASRCGSRYARVARIDQDVPPVGVSWLLSCFNGGQPTAPSEYWTSRRGAERAAQAWVARKPRQERNA